MQVSSVGRHRPGSPGAISVGALVRVVRRNFFVALFVPGKHRWARVQRPQLPARAGGVRRPAAQPA